MVHKEETLVCPSVKYADQISQCKQIHCKDCREKEEKTNKKVEQLEKKLKVMTIVGAIAATVVGKDIVDKVVASFSDAAEAAGKIQDAAKSAAGSDAAPANAVSSINKLLRPQFPLGNGSPYQFIDGNRSAYVTELDTPFAMDPSWDKPRSSQQTMNIVFSSPRVAVARTNLYELPQQEQQGKENLGMKLTMASARQQMYADSPLSASFATSSPFGGYDGDIPAFGSFSAVPAPSTACVLFGIGLFRRRTR